MDMGGEEMKRLIFAAIVFLISVFLISHLYSKAFGADLKNITDKKENNLVVISTLNLPAVEITQIYDRGAKVVCYVARGKKGSGKAAYVTSMQCMSITELSRTGVNFIKQYQ